MAKERGSASILVDLTDGIITITHGTDGATLDSWQAREGDWMRIWDCLEELSFLAGLPKEGE